MSPEELELARHAIDSLFWLGVIWVVVGGVFNYLATQKITAEFDHMR
jgi:hypothetical protein